MGSRSKPTTFQKRQKELARKQKQQAKAARRLEVKARKAAAGPRAAGDTDPDIAGIRPGPQPLPPQWDAPDEIP